MFRDHFCRDLHSATVGEAWGDRQGQCNKVPNCVQNSSSVLKSRFCFGSSFHSLKTSVNGSLKATIERISPFVYEVNSNGHYQE